MCVSKGVGVCVSKGVGEREYVCLRDREGDGVCVLKRESTSSVAWCF